MAMKFPVGEYIQDELDARGWTTRDCADRMAAVVGGNPAEWELTLDLCIAVCDAPEGYAIHKTTLGQETSDALAAVLGCSAETLLRLDVTYRPDLRPNRKDSTMSVSRKIGQRLVITVPPSSEPTEVVVEVRDVRGKVAWLNVPGGDVRREEVKMEAGCNHDWACHGGQHSDACPLRKKAI